MLSNYFKIAWRSIWHNKVYSLINIVGLAVGLTVVMLIMLYVQDDLTFDRFHTKQSQIYRIVQDQMDGSDKVRKIGNTGFVQGPTFKDEVAEIGQFCRIKNGWNTIVKKDKEGLEENLLYVDTAFFSMFSFQVLAGSTAKALTNPDQVVITDKIAQKYFGSSDPIGQTIQIGDEGADTFEPFEVVAVLKSPPSNSSIQFDLLQSIDHIIPTDPEQRTRQSNWFNANLNTFVFLHPKALEAEAEAKLNQSAAKYIEKSRAEAASKWNVQYYLQPLASMHLDPEFNASNGLRFWSDAWYPKVLSGMGLAILLIACINFVNLSLARSLRRTKEIGVRKVTGGTRNQILTQFMTESFLMAALAFAPALAMAYLSVPAFSKMLDKPLESDYLFQSSTLALFGTLLFVVTFLAGIYPSLVVSGFNPIKSLKGESNISKRSVLGQSLVVLQFALAGILLIGTLIANEQFKFIANTDLGYRTENIIRFWLPFICRIPGFLHSLIASTWSGGCSQELAY